ncbi:MAG: single-stranded DNA-binding protein [bacterium]
MNLNKVFILGRLTADPQLRTTPSGESVGTFSVATNQYWTDKGGNRKESTEFHNIVVWGKQAELASQYLFKGGIVLVEGRLQTRSWESKDGGQRRTTEVIADRLQFGPRKEGGASSGYNNEQPPRTENKSNGASNKQTIENDMPVIDLDEDTIRPEDLPF